MGDKYFAIPWNALHFNLTEKRAVLNVDKKLLRRMLRVSTRATGQTWLIQSGETAFTNTMAMLLTGKKRLPAAN